MRVTVQEGILKTATGQSKTPFRVMMAYDDFASGKRAMNACNFLVRQLGGDAELRSSMWKFDVLRSAKLNEIAVEDAIEADVIIVATARDGGLPDSVKTWLAGWVPRKQGHPAALVALLDFTPENANEADQVRALLKDAASEAQIDFLPQQIRFAGNTFPTVTSLPPADPAPRKTAIPPDSRTPSFEGWGIND